ncbi:MAG: helix-turn-helix transcriptional regulator, partial [Oscillospiraceae bacterium]|nr:helix-turn-helix transcriptional regulator [Oscillospiraceae bacterium]
MSYTGFLIRKLRLEKNWSQEGLCKGICAVSYLSKIEQGKAEASEEILKALFERLGT